MKKINRKLLSALIFILGIGTGKIIHNYINPPIESIMVSGKDVNDLFKEYKVTYNTSGYAQRENAHIDYVKKQVIFRPLYSLEENINTIIHETIHYKNRFATETQTLCATEYLMSFGDARQTAEKYARNFPLNDIQKTALSIE